MSSMSYDVREFRKTVIGYWKKDGRHNLPWRKTHDPYTILVTEIMLQQTQVDRVVPYYERFIKRFSTVQALSRAPLEVVLREWSGLGYNRRAKLLRECAKEIVEKHASAVPKDFAALVALPAIGPYTAGAIRVFAFNFPDTLIETNIRTVFFHHFQVFHKYDGRPSDGIMRDAEIYRVAKEAARGQDPRTWHAALMDYGAHLKRSGVRLNERSAHYTKQSRFEGSQRQARGAVLRKLLDGPVSEKSLLTIDVKASYQIEQALRDMHREGLIDKRNKKWRLSD